nr:SIR2 family protein [Bradyrhizobium iriomotense]
MCTLRLYRRLPATRKVLIVAIPANLLGDLRETLLAGRYSLFLGAGVNVGGKLSSGKDLPLGDQLRQQLVALKGLKSNSSLARAYGQLTQPEKDQYLTDAFSNCTPSPALLKLPHFFWHRVYTLNIDDALEASYKVKSSLQTADPRGRLAPYVEASDITCLQIAHIHGWSQRPEDGYIFSLAEYAGSMGPGNPWVNVLAHTLATEPFVIAGTSLEEPDLEYFLSGRSVHSVRTDRGPSFLIEPFPDAATEKECARHGLVLYSGTFDEFLSELLTNFPDRPLPISAPSGLSKDHFATNPKTKDLALFSRDFSFVVAHQVQENADLGFLVGRAPSLEDIALGRDIPRKSTLALKSEIRRRMSGKSWDVNFLLIDENAGTGKSTVLRRALFDLAAEGFSIFDYRSISTPDIDLCAKIFNLLKGPFIISCDDFADHVPAIVELYKNINRNDFLILGCERAYRMNYVLQTLAGNARATFTLSAFNVEEAKLLAQKLDDVGLASIPAKYIDMHAQDVSHDPIALAVCRILNNFRSAEDIIRSLLKDADSARIQRYLASAVASYCYRAGLRYDILSSAFDPVDLQRQFSSRDMLPLAYSNEGQRDYVVPLNPILGEQVLRRVQELDPSLVFDVYCAVGSYLSSYVIVKR